MIEVLKQALDYIENVPDDRDSVGHINRGALVISLNQAIAELESQEPQGVQVSPIQFVESTFGRGHLVGKPVIWAEWPSREKNT